MSLNAQRAYDFLAPLKGKIVTFLVDDRKTNLSFAKSIASLTAMTACSCTVFDIDAFYSSNSDEILAALPLSAAKSTRICVPEPGSNVETEILVLFRRDSEVLIVESLNTLFHLFEPSGVSSKNRKLAFVLVGLSYLAKTTGKTGFLVMYRRKRLTKIGGNGPISNLSDMTVSVQVSGSELRLECERGTAWPGGRFSLILL